MSHDFGAPIPLDPGEKPQNPAGTNKKWGPIILEAERVARSYTTAVTLRQLHYRLVASSTGGYANKETDYTYLSKLTAEARREGHFPSLSDTTRRVVTPSHFIGPEEALTALADRFRLDRTRDQDYQVWVLFEKATLGAQVEAWTAAHGLPTAALRGYSSESLEREVFDGMQDDGRPIVAFYIGDLDPEGEDIERNFLAQSERQGVSFKHWERLAVTPQQVTEYQLVANPGKPASTRATAFTQKHGRLFQIEAEAVDPGTLRTLVMNAIQDSSWFDHETWDQVKDDEALGREQLQELADNWDSD